MAGKSTVQERREAALLELTQKSRAPKKSFFGRKVSKKALSQFTSQLAILQDAGLPIVRCLKILEGQMKPGYFKWVLASVTDDVESGTPLSDAFAKHGEVFDDLYVNMVKAGEAGGILDTILVRLATFMEKAQRLRKRVISASIYPAVVLVVALAILLFIMLTVVPKFELVFNKLQGGQLPGITLFMLDVSKWLTGKNGPFPLAGLVFLLAGAAFLVVVFRLIVLSERGRRSVDNAKLRLPLLGDLTRKSAVARFSRTFGTLIQSGVPILEALNIVRDSIGNVVVKQAVEKVHDAIREGENIARPLGDSGIFDDLVVNMIDVGEETGELDRMLIKVADTYDEEVDMAVQSLLSILEPTLIVFMGFAVGVIVVSLFLPLIRLTQQLGAQR